MQRPRSPSPERNMDTKPKPVYSDFSHMSAKQGMGGIKFAVGLREENAEEIIARVFPLTKIIPAPKKEKKPKKKEKKVEDKVCTRPDCAARKEKLNELQNENQVIKDKLKGLEDQLETSKNKISFTEKSIILAEEKNDSLNGQIEEAQSRIINIEADVEKVESFNQTLRKQLSSLLAEIENIKRETEEKNKKLQDILEDKTEKKIIFSKDPKYKDFRLAKEVSELIFSNEDDSD